LREFPRIFSMNAPLESQGFTCPIHDERPESMTSTIFYLLQVIAIILVVMGYRNNNRNLLLAAALCIWAGYGTEDFVSGFIEGYRRV